LLSCPRSVAAILLLVQNWIMYLIYVPAVY